MTEFLLFRLYGMMASWGQIAPGEVRASWVAPSKSAILGLVAAALGIDRTDDDAHAALHAALGFAAELRRPGQPLKDYHTAQTPEGKGPWITRADELQHTKLKTILSDRDYYLGQESVVALWSKHASIYSLAAITMALRQPHYVLFLGRKSCPLALPLEPKLTVAEGLAAALSAYTPSLSPDMFATLETPKYVRVFSDRDAPGVTLDKVTFTSRRDGIAKRSRWRFADRAEIEFMREAKT